jgi:hypothetical protein
MIRILRARCNSILAAVGIAVSRPALSTQPHLFGEAGSSGLRAHIRRNLGLQGEMLAIAGPKGELPAATLLRSHQGYVDMEQQIRAARRQIIWALVVGFVWTACSFGGLALLAIYAGSSAPPQPIVSQWPADTHLQLSKHEPTLVLFAHPRCPCTRATLGELEKIVARNEGAFTLWIVFFKPSNSDESWTRTDLVSTAETIPGALIIADVDGLEAERFHVTTSGQTLFYSSRGELLFEGGITLARGHAGDNPGSSAIESYLAGVPPTYQQTPVFGCPIAVSTQQERRVQ